jgi:ATP-dependent Clp protease ATP-binding subunit ClpC
LRLLSTFDRYTDQAKRVIYFARLEALHRDQTSISTKDLLAALTWDSDTRVERVAAVKSKCLELRATLEIPHLPTTALPYSRQADIPLTDESKKTLAYAVFEADHDREFWLDTDHLLRGLLRFDNAASPALTKAGIELTATRDSSLTDRRTTRPQHPPFWKKLLLFARWHGPWIWFFLFVLFLLLFEYNNP